MGLKVGDRVLYGSDRKRADVLEIFENGKVRISFWVDKFGGKVELMKLNVSAKELARA